jgi:hypothetical protein
MEKKLKATFATECELKSVKAKLQENNCEMAIAKSKLQSVIVASSQITEAAMVLNEVRMCEQL